jgi:hypothetical protein
MGDENYRKPTSPRATRVGLGLSGVDRPDAPLTGTDRRGAAGRTVTGVGSSVPAVYSEHPEHDHDAEDRYMDPPSETYGVEREEIVRRLREDTEASAARASASPSGQGLFGTTLRAHTEAHAPTVRPPGYNPSDFVDEGSHSGNVEQGLLAAALDHTQRAQPVAAPEPAYEPAFAAPTPLRSMSAQPLDAPAYAPPRSAPPEPARAPGSGSRAPESWRDEVRRMVERGPMKNPPPAPPGPSAPSGSGGHGQGGGGSYGGGGGYGGPGGGGGGPGGGGPTVPGGPSLQHKPSLRLQLDANNLEDVYRTPKSVIPKLLFWLVILIVVGGATAYVVGNDSLMGRSEPVAPTLEPAAATPEATAPGAQPPAATAPATTAPVQAAPAANPSAAPAAAHPSAAAPTQPTAATPAATAAPAATPTQPAAADTAQPAAAEQVPEKKLEPPVAAKPAAPKAPVAPKAPPRVVHRQEPVVKVRPIDAPTSSAPAERGAAEPVDEPPYVPIPGDPPSPGAP